MGLLKKLKSVLGLGGARSSPTGGSSTGDVDVTIEREPSTETEDAVKGTETPTGTGNVDDAGSGPGDAGSGPGDGLAGGSSVRDATPVDEADDAAASSRDPVAETAATPDEESGGGGIDVGGADDGAGTDVAGESDTASEPSAGDEVAAASEASLSEEADAASEPSVDDEGGATEPSVDDEGGATEPSVGDEAGATSGTGIGGATGAGDATAEAGESGVDEAATDDAGASAEPVTEINGVGPAYGERLEAAGVDTVADLVAADAAELAEATDIAEGRIESWIEQASDR